MLILARIASLFICLLALAVECKCDSTKIDVSQCFPDVLVTKLTTNVTEHYLYYYLAIIDESTYKKAQDNASTSALTAYGFFSGDWNHFREERRKFFALHNESIDYYRTQFTDLRYLPTEWHSTIDNCINRLTANAGYGVYYQPVVIGPQLIRLELKYKPTGNDYLRVRSSEIKNGSLDDEGKVKSLYRPCYVKASDITCPRMDSQSEFFIRRTDPNDKVSINLNVDDPKHSTGLDIDPMPKKVKCKTTYENSPVKSETRKVEIHSALIQEYWGGDNQQLYLIEAHFPGKVVYATCIAYDSFNATLNNDPNQRQRWHDWHGLSSNPDWKDDVVRCMGRTNTGPDNRRETWITANYQESQEVCTEIDW